MTLEKFLDKPSAFIFSQGIAPLVHERLKDRPDIRIDKELSEELEEYFRYRCLFHLQIEAETKGALARLQKASIETLLLKGFPLSYLLYGTPALRPYSDVDILVRKEKASDVKSVLTPLGYSFPPGVSGDYISQEFVAEKNANGIPVALDFHLALSSAVFFKDLFTFDELKNASIELGGSFDPSVRTLSWAHALILACIHLVGHHPSDLRLIWLYDIHLLAERMSAAEFEAFAALAASKKVASVCLYTMRQAEQAFGTPIPASVSALWESAAASEKESALYLKDRTALGDFWINWRLIPDASGKAMYLKELFFPPEEYMRGRYTKHKHAPLPWLYLRRGWKGMLKWLSR